MVDPEESSFKQLSLKTVMRMALANVDRASDLHLLDIRYMQSQFDQARGITIVTVTEVYNQLLTW